MSAYRDYGFHDTSNSHIHKWLLEPLKSSLGQSKNRKILDVGCGNGWLARILLAEGYDVFGTDASLTGIQQARVSHPDRFFVQNIESNELPEPLRTVAFDTIISTEVIEHLYNPASYVQFCKNVLMRHGGGELIVSTPYHGYLKYLALAVTGSMDKHLTALWVGGHIKFWSEETITKLLKDQGFTVERIDKAGRFPFLWKSMIVKASILKKE